VSGPNQITKIGCHVVVGVNLTDRADLAVGADDDAVVEGLEGLVTIV
jgi:hypothetical protein